MPLNENYSQKEWAFLFQKGSERSKISQLLNLRTKSHKWNVSQT